MLHKLGSSASVTVFDAQPRIGGLWPLSADDDDDDGCQVPPLMVANQSRHTVQFSDCAWDPSAPQLPRAFQVGQFLRRYADRYICGRVEWKLGTRVVRASRIDGGGWSVVTRREADKVEETRRFGYLVVASGFFGRPVVDEALRGQTVVPVVHSSRYRDLATLFGGGSARRGKIVVVGGQMSGVETAATIAAHISSARHSPDVAVSDVNGDSLTVHHLVQRPVWVFPLHTTPNARSSSRLSFFFFSSY